MTRTLPRLLAGVLALSGCHKDHTEAPASPPSPAIPTTGPGSGSGVGASSVSGNTDRTPRSRADYPTDEGVLAMTNLDSLIEGQNGLKAKMGKDGVNANVRLTALYLLRGQLTGHIADYEMAEALDDELLKAEPKNPMAWMMRGQVLATWHRFDEALAAYDKAQKFGTKPVELEGARLGLSAAQGKDDEAVFAYKQKQAKELPNIETLSSLGITLGDRGDLAAAATAFGDAQDKYRDVSPLPVATIYFQQGLLEQRSGSPARARELFQAAHDRLPQHAQVTSHLASVLAVTGARDKAIALLEPLKTADDPEYAGQLAALLDEGTPEQKARATTLRKDAAARYEALLAKHELAFADHAARFYLSGPKDQQNIKRALELAQKNANNRPTADAQRLLVDAALAANDTKLACATAETLAARPHAGPEVHVSAARAFTACGQKERADKEVALIASPARAATP